MNKKVSVLIVFCCFTIVAFLSIFVYQQYDKKQSDYQRSADKNSMGYIREYGASSEDYIDVSFTELLANKDSYHMQNIRIKGVASYAIEDQVLYETINAYKIKNSSNGYKGFWLSFPKEALEKFGGKAELVDICGKEVIIEGRYDNTPTGFAAKYFGEIDNISFVGVLQ